MANENDISFIFSIYIPRIKTITFLDTNGQDLVVKTSVLDAKKANFLLMQAQNRLISK